MNLSGGEIGIIAVIGILLFGGLVKSKPIKPSTPNTSKKIETNTTADFQKANSINSTTPVTKINYK